MHAVVLDQRSESSLADEIFMVRGRCGSEKNRCILKEAPSTMRPRQLPPPNHVDVQVEDGLPRARAVVDHDPIII